MRLSNFELLRIISMMGVLTSHSLMSMYDLHTTNFSVINEIRVFVMNASCLAVNCFVMISGWFQIRQSWKSFYGLFTPILFWSVVCCGTALAFGECNLIDFGKHLIFPMTETGLWFIKTYLALFLIAPFLNSAINNMNDSQLRWSSLMLLIVDVYIGYLHQSHEITIDGYHLVHFITLYVLGSTLRKANWLQQNVCKLFIIVVLLLLLMTGLHMCKMVFLPTAVIYSLRYNSPILMVTSILTFLLFANLKIESKIINWISESVLAVYLISSLPFFGPRYYEILKELSTKNTGILALVLIVGVMMSFYFICIVADKVRKLMVRSIDKKIKNFLPNN